MYIQEKPYIPFAAAMIFAALPLALLMHELAALLFGARGLLLAEQGGHYALAGYWRDSTVWFVCGVFGFLNIPLSAGLVKIAHRKMMRRRWRYALFLAGIGACASVFAAFIIESVVGSGALGGMRGTGVFYYTLSVFVLAMCFLPKQLTRAPVQTVVFYKPKK